jgi:ubiquinone/menaquinone biosynthesis C-methylase UbiE
MDVTEFRRASHDVWEAMAAGWDARNAYFERTARPVTERMLERLAPGPGQTILDLAAGTGALGLAAAAAMGSEGRVIVSDFSQAMVDAAARRAAQLGLANVECRVLDAERLDLPDDAVDGVLCRWGYMLMADPAAAFAETRRVLRQGGRLSCSVFAEPERNPWAALPARVLQEAGHMAPPAAGAPGILALGDRDRLRGLFTGAGLSEPEIDEVAFTFDFPDFDAYWGFLTSAAGAIAMVIGRLGDDERDRVRARVEELTAGYGGELPVLALVAAA